MSVPLSRKLAGKLQPDCAIFIVCNANARSGMGHLVRCLSLAKQLEKKHQPVCMLGDFSDMAQLWMNELGIRFEHQASESIARVLASLPARAKLVVDSYELKVEHLIPTQQVVLIDDFARLASYPVSGVLNFTLQAAQYDYLKLGAQSQALGVAYFLPNPFIKPCSKPFVSQPKKLLILIGSGDPHDIASDLLQAFSMVDTPLSLRVIAGRSISVDVKKNIHHQISVLPLQQDISPHYFWADMCITSGGLAKYESAFLGCPPMVISQTEAEWLETKQFAKAGLCFDFGYVGEFYGTSFAYGFIQNFKSLLGARDERQAAYDKCQQTFVPDSAENAANYVLRCLTRPGD